MLIRTVAQRAHPSHGYTVISSTDWILVLCDSNNDTKKNGVSTPSAFQSKSSAWIIRSFIARSLPSLVAYLLFNCTLCVVHHNSSFMPEIKLNYSIHIPNTICIWLSWHSAINTHIAQHNAYIALRQSSHQIIMKYFALFLFIVECDAHCDCVRARECI